MAQKDPLVEYTSEGHRMFEELNFEIRGEVIQTLFHAEIEVEDADALQRAQAAQAGDGFAYEHESLAGAQAIAAAGGGAAAGMMLGDGSGVTAGALDAGGGSVMTQQRVTSERDKIGRNDPCWCGSGKKYKRCHGA
jgi:preprotein translocase subunit SecA